MENLCNSTILWEGNNKFVYREVSNLFLVFQMSKSTGNFLTLRQAVDKFSADGKLAKFRFI